LIEAYPVPHILDRCRPGCAFKAKGDIINLVIDPLISGRDMALRTFGYGCCLPGAALGIAAINSFLVLEREAAVSGGYCRILILQ